ncbi:MAG: hypothetical protein K8L99_08395 [Anaerolineae bacterium]|nr:hypothetical protein [Anaerolineae bacterium]
MERLKDKIESWLAVAQSRLEDGGVTTSDLEQLKQMVAGAQAKQHLLYLHVKSPSIYSPVIGMAEHKPTPDGQDRIHTRQDWPYNNVHDAIVDGWYVIHFPQQMVPFDDRELDYVGYEFVLQKTEEVIS